MKGIKCMQNRTKAAVFSFYPIDKNFECRINARAIRYSGIANGHISLLTRLNIPLGNQIRRALAILFGSNEK